MTARSLLASRSVPTGVRIPTGMPMPAMLASTMASSLLRSAAGLRPTAAVAIRLADSRSASWYRLHQFADECRNSLRHPATAVAATTMLRQVSTPATSQAMWATGSPASTSSMWRPVVFVLGNYGREFLVRYADGRALWYGSEPQCLEQRARPLVRQGRSA